MRNLSRLSSPKKSIDALRSKRPTEQSGVERGASPETCSNPSDRYRLTLATKASRPSMRELKSAGRIGFGTAVEKAQQLPGQHHRHEQRVRRISRIKLERLLPTAQAQRLRVVVIVIDRERRLATTDRAFVAAPSAHVYRNAERFQRPRYGVGCEVQYGLRIRSSIGFARDAVDFSDRAEALAEKHLR